MNLQIYRQYVIGTTNNIDTTTKIDTFPETSTCTRAKEGRILFLGLHYLPRDKHWKLISSSSFQHSRSQNPENETKSSPILKYEKFYYTSVHYMYQEIWPLDRNYLT